MPGGDNNDCKMSAVDDVAKNRKRSAPEKNAVAEFRKKPPQQKPAAAAKRQNNNNSNHFPGSESRGGPSNARDTRGLRHFSMMVCKKVEEKGTTTYNQVADELVEKVIADRKGDVTFKFDAKNIRRRVYDALNVLMAMDIIAKDKKMITWKGLPSNAHVDFETMERERDARKAQVERKREALKELLIQQVCFRNLVRRNQQQNNNNEEKIPLPFVVVNTHSSAVIQCEMSRDRTDVMLDFSTPFEINDDNTILKRLGMHKTTMPVLQELLPEDLLGYCREHGILDAILVEPETDSSIMPPPDYDPAESSYRARRGP